MGITRASFILFVGNLVGMGGYYLFQVYMSRNLTPAEFGIINALQALFFVIAAPANIFAQSLNKHFGQLFALKKLHSIRENYFYFFRGLIYLSLLGLGLYLFLSGSIAQFLKIDSYYPMLITGVWIFSFFFLQLNQGFLQGAHQFTSMSFSLGIQGGFRWIFGVLLVVAGFGLNGALSAQPLAFFLAYGVTMVAVFSQFPDKSLSDRSLTPDRIDLPKFLSESYPIFFAQLAVIILCNMDMILVKHYLSPYDAGLYSSLAVMGRGVLFLSEAIVVGMFSIGVHENAVQADVFSTYHRAILLCMVMYLAVLATFWFIPDFIITVIFGEKYLVNAPFLKLIGISMAFLGMLRVLTNFNLSRNSHRFIFFLYLAIVVEVLLIALFHDSILQILLIMVIITTTLFVSNEYIIIREQKICRIIS